MIVIPLPAEDVPHILYALYGAQQQRDSPNTTVIVPSSRADDKQILEVCIAHTCMVHKVPLTVACTEINVMKIFVFAYPDDP